MLAFDSANGGVELMTRREFADGRAPAADFGGEDVLGILSVTPPAAVGAADAAGATGSADAGGIETDAGTCSLLFSGPDDKRRLTSEAMKSSSILLLVVTEADKCKPPPSAAVCGRGGRTGSAGANRCARVRGGGGGRRRAGGIVIGRAAGPTRSRGCVNSGIDDLLHAPSLPDS